LLADLCQPAIGGTITMRRALTLRPGVPASCASEATTAYTLDAEVVLSPTAALAVSGTYTARETYPAPSPDDCTLEITGEGEVLLSVPGSDDGFGQEVASAVELYGGGAGGLGLAIASTHTTVATGHPSCAGTDVREEAFVFVLLFVEEDGVYVFDRDATGETTCTSEVATVRGRVTPQ
ncbi:MAG: hypothetical protein KC656_35335, partial [Myxococcales bacterium]|nr:hypothetical protein [Myxococcales bacterium]